MTDEIPLEISSIQKFMLIVRNLQLTTFNYVLYDNQIKHRFFHSSLTIGSSIGP
jgi:hypothetical protein